VAPRRSSSRRAHTSLSSSASRRLAISAYEIIRASMMHGAGVGMVGRRRCSSIVRSFLRRLRRPCAAAAGGASRASSMDIACVDDRLMSRRRVAPSIAKKAVRTTSRHDGLPVPEFSDALNEDSQKRAGNTEHHPHQNTHSHRPAGTSQNKKVW
jgi:hypothetical protein